ncbi:MAG: TPM domain-containing protein [Bacteroidales bacterium]|nr:TPM domain-containing protein [Bacteroidales bacterium]
MKRLCLILALLMIGVAGLAQKIPARPTPPRLVNDFANIMTDKQERALEKKLVAYNDSTSTQICVVTVTSLNGTTSNDFAYQIGEKWGVGHKENNGAIILVLPKIGNAYGDVAIQVGYGMEAYVTDAMARRIIELEMIPAFKENNYYKGINNACDAIIGLATGAYKGNKRNSDDDSDTFGIFILIFSLLFVLFLIKLLGRNRGGGSSGRRLSFWEGFFIGNLMSGGGRSRGNNWGGSSWGSGHSSGGFGGFGGGHFGGGGASGKW